MHVGWSVPVYFILKKYFFFIFIINFNCDYIFMRVLLLLLCK